MSDWFKNSIKVEYDYFVLCMNSTLLTNYCSHSKSTNQSIHETLWKNRSRVGTVLHTKMTWKSKLINSIKVHKIIDLKWNKSQTILCDKKDNKGKRKESPQRRVLCCLENHKLLIWIPT